MAAKLDAEDGIAHVDLLVMSQTSYYCSTLQKNGVPLALVLIGVILDKSLHSFFSFVTFFIISVGIIPR